MGKYQYILLYWDNQHILLILFLC